MDLTLMKHVSAGKALAVQRTVVQATQTAPAPELDSDWCWAGLVNKDPSRDGAYVFAVKTTGIYCRPSCPSRTPKRSNVVFLNNGAQALALGFRACKRCDPEGTSKRQQQVEAILSACRLIETSEQKMRLNTLAAKVGLSAHHFHRLFKDVTGLTPHDFYKARQIAQIGQAVRSNSSVTAAIYDAGFSSSGRFYENTNTMLGMTPKAYQKGGEGQGIRYAIRNCAFGLLLVAASERGICAIEFGEQAEPLVASLKTRFPKSNFLPDDPVFSDWLKKLLAHLDQPSQSLDLPLDIQGTIFQQQVWKALQQIPLGSTQSYAEVAARIGKPKAVRAVAQACANNLLAVAIPCHRVVRSNGSLSGYRWGVSRKKALLEFEASIQTVDTI
jgi:AraC family transcriptional regulator, regulatory protein of adaptative response / methylated-DNA-[protein]-cysteine methyltransferase